MEVSTLPLTAGEHALLAALATDATLADAAEAALDAEPGLDLTTTLARHLARGSFTDFASPQVKETADGHDVVR
jgi:hypothetical protein